MNHPSKETMAKYLHQLHWNKVLCEKSVITQREYLKIANMLHNQKVFILSFGIHCHSCRNSPFIRSALRDKILPRKAIRILREADCFPKDKRRE